MHHLSVTFYVPCWRASVGCQVEERRTIDRLYLSGAKLGEEFGQWVRELTAKGWDFNLLLGGQYYAICPQCSQSEGTGGILELTISQLQEVSDEPTINI